MTKGSVLRDAFLQATAGRWDLQREARRYPALRQLIVSEQCALRGNYIGHQRVRFIVRRV